MKKNFIFSAGLLMAVFSSTILSCTPVKQYQKQYLNDSEMELSARNSQKFESNFHSYREAASGVNGGKTGGGCGCN